MGGRKAHKQALKRAAKARKGRVRQGEVGVRAGKLPEHRHVPAGHCSPPRRCLAAGSPEEEASLVVHLLGLGPSQVR